MKANELLEIISKQWCNTEDLIKITGLGRNTVLKLKKQIKNALNTREYSLPNGLLPMNEVVKYLKIDIDYLEDINSKTIRGNKLWWP